MDDRLMEIKKEYENLEIPEELDNIVDGVIKSYKMEERIDKMKRGFVGGIAASVILLTGLTIGINKNPVFAKSLKGVPVLNKFVELVDNNEKDIKKVEKSKVINAKVNVPKISGLESKDLENKVNEEIKSIMDIHLKKAEEKGKEFKESYLSKGGKLEDYRPLLVTIDYDLKYATDDKISFSIFYSETMATSFEKTYFYTIDLNKNKKLTLKDFFGKNYKEYIDKIIKNKIQVELEQSPSKYFTGDNGFHGISNKQKFYLNSAGDVVVVFDSYEIAPGSTGEPEFIIPVLKK